jgi:hypothetical protein
MDGIADISSSVIGYTPDIFPAMQAIDLPMGYPNASLATKAIDDFYAKEITAKGFPGQKYIDFI